MDPLSIYAVPSGFKVGLLQRALPLVVVVQGANV